MGEPPCGSHPFCHHPSCCGSVSSAAPGRNQSCSIRRRREPPRISREEPRGDRGIGSDLRGTRAYRAGPRTLCSCRPCTGVEIKKVLEQGPNAKLAVKTPHVFLVQDDIAIAVKLIDAQF